MVVQRPVHASKSSRQAMVDALRSIKPSAIILPVVKGF
jgi:hypothetical protein